MPSKRPKKEKPIKGRCGAKLRKKPGRFCKIRPIKGRKRCRFHGGTTPRGIASPQFIHGKYSSVLKGALAENFQNSAADPELLSLRGDIALADARLFELVKETQDADDGSASWKECNAIVRQIDAIKKTPGITPAEIGAQTVPLMDKLWATIKSGARLERKWETIGKQKLLRMRLIESERKRMIEAGLMVAIGEARTLVAALAHVVRENVHDPRTLNIISEEFERITSGGYAPDSPAGTGKGN